MLQRNERYYKGIAHALQTIHRDEGLRGLYKGMGTTLLVITWHKLLNWYIEHRIIIDMYMKFS